jgi:hypothetical protein
VALAPAAPWDRRGRGRRAAERSDATPHRTGSMRRFTIITSGEPSVRSRNGTAGRGPGAWRPANVTRAGTTLAPLTGSLPTRCARVWLTVAPWGPLRRSEPGLVSPRREPDRLTPARFLPRECAGTSLRHIGMQLGGAGLRSVTRNSLGALSGDRCLFLILTDSYLPRGWRLPPTSGRGPRPLLASNPASGTRSGALPCRHEHAPTAAQ